MKRVAFHFRKPQRGLNSVEELFATILDHLPSDVTAHRHELPMAGASPASLWHNCRAAFRQRADVHHVTGHVNYVATVLRGPVVMTVLDTGSALTGNLLRRLAMLILWFWLPALRAQRIVAISESTARELTRLVPFARARIRVVHCPANPRLSFVPKPFDDARPSVLHIGTKPNKNLDRTVQALTGLGCRLTVIGDLSTEQRTRLQDSGIEYENRWGLPYGEIVREYERCDLVCFASTYEGFGMPIIEANAVGRPVIAGNVASMPEVAGDAACLVNPFSVDSIRAGLQQIIREPGYREQLIRNGQANVKRFAPATIALRYAAVYEEALRGRMA